MSNQPIEIKVQNYSENYGGVDVIIDGREASFGSVVGYALYNGKDPAAAVIDCLEKAKKFPYGGFVLVWISLSSVCISGDPGYYERQEARRALMPKLSVGDEVKFEGNVYRIVRAPNNNFGLVKV